MPAKKDVELEVELTNGELKTLFLTESQYRFCEEYAMTGLPSASYRKAFPKASDITARTNAGVLRKIPDIQLAIKHFKHKISLQVSLSNQEIIDKLESIINSDPLDLIDENGRIKHLDDVPEDTRSCLDIEFKGSADKQRNLFNLDYNTNISYSSSNRLKALKELAVIKGLSRPEDHSSSDNNGELIYDVSATAKD